MTMICRRNGMKTALLVIISVVYCAFVSSQFTSCPGVCPDGSTVTPFLQLGVSNSTCGDVDAMARNGLMECSEARVLSSFCECPNLDFECRVCPPGTRLADDINIFQRSCRVFESSMLLSDSANCNTNVLELLSSRCGECVPHDEHLLGSLACNLCPDGQDVGNPDTVLPGSDISCEAYSFFLAFANETECEEARPPVLQSLCGCPSISTSGNDGGQAPCQLCADGSAPGNANLDIPEVNFTCSVFSSLLLANTNQTECAEIQSSILPQFCGCPSNTTSSCSICPDGGTVGNPNVIVSLPDSSDGDNLTCAQYELALQFTPALGEDDELDACASIQQLLSEPCGCANPIVPNCTLCEDGSPSPNQDVVFDVNTTCATLEQGARAFPNAVCPSLQGTAGTYCGCNNTATAAQACRICGNGTLLPDPALVAGQDEFGDPVGCGELEFEGSVDPTQCSEIQAKHAAICCAGVTAMPSTSAPTTPVPTTGAPTTAPPSPGPTAAVSPAPTPTSMATTTSYTDTILFLGYSWTTLLVVTQVL